MVIKSSDKLRGEKMSKQNQTVYKDNGKSWDKVTSRATVTNLTVSTTGNIFGQVNTISGTLEVVCFDFFSNEWYII